ncbi:Translocon-associated protein subunit alpha [Camellia lanceoleosa]|uniref:Translocon-associated protein subunit alpha n=1 Tax=Camellia lanceoleosa TaxID=1840588 RepID=A0ACC0J1Y8_9ERIC|nr:Translocon-associated protein subunit alpha [Camellia lanceoleosa]
MLQKDIVNEGGDLGIIGDDVFAFGDSNFSPALGVETICFFPKNPSPLVAAGEEGELIVGMKNEGYLTGGGFGFSNSNFNVCGSLMCGGCMDNGYTYGS